MGGFFGAVSRRDVVLDVFAGGGLFPSSGVGVYDGVCVGAGKENAEKYCEASWIGVGGGSSLFPICFEFTGVDGGGFADE